MGDWNQGQNGAVVTFELRAALAGPPVGSQENDAWLDAPAGPGLPGGAYARSGA